MMQATLSASRRATYITVAALCMVATFPGRTHGLGFITESVLQDLSIDRTLYSYYNLVATLAGALFCIPIGAWLDRIGCRKTLSIVLALLGVSVLAMSAVQSKALFFVCLLLTRGFGQSALSVASITLISKYFPKSKLGPAMGIYSVLTSAFFVGAFGGMGAALEHLQPCTLMWRSDEIIVPVWRMAWGGIGVILLAFFVPLVLLCVRRRHVLPVAEAEQARPLEEAGVSFAQAIRTPVFWIFGLSIAFYGMVSSGIALHNEDILLERG
ncbi:MAG: MFS transporter, partial [Prevotellaceae bacterium]|nr:MFS transporter [Prevotellaceae bacterium]